MSSSIVPEFVVEGSKSMIGRGAIPAGIEAFELPRPSQRGEPSWEVACCFPRQGEWSNEDYLAFETANFPVELVDGCLEFLPMPTLSHQRLVRSLFLTLDQAVRASGKGEAAFAPCPIQLWESHYREPDVFYLSSERSARGEDPPTGVDLVIEVMSPGQTNRERDLIKKRADYARAGVSEYWIVDPEEQVVSVLALDGETYRVHGEFKPGTMATSLLLPAFQVNVADLFEAAKPGS